MKKITTIALVLALVFMAPTPKAQQIIPACYIAFLTVVIGGVMIYGIYKCCQQLDQQANPPDDIPPEVSSNLPPGGGPPGTIQVLPPLRLQHQLFGEYITAQYKDGLPIVDTRDPGWQTAFKFQAQMSPNGLQIVACDANGTPLLTNTPTVVDTATGPWAIFDFTGLPQTVTNNPPCRLFRLVGSQ